MQREEREFERYRQDKESGQTARALDEVLLELRRTQDFQARISENLSSELSETLAKAIRETVANTRASTTTTLTTGEGRDSKGTEYRVVTGVSQFWAGSGVVIG